MTSEELVKKIKQLLKTDGDLEFLLRLERKKLETLVVCIRERVDQVGRSGQRKVDVTLSVL